MRRNFCNKIKSVGRYELQLTNIEVAVTAGNWLSAAFPFQFSRIYFFWLESDREDELESFKALDRQMSFW